jgi:hypothetical protein
MKVNPSRNTERPTGWPLGVGAVGSKMGQELTFGSDSSASEVLCCTCTRSSCRFESAMPASETKCGHCGKEEGLADLKRYSRCQSVSYCSKE